LKLLKVKEVAEILQVTEQTVYNLIYKNELKGTKVGRSVRIREKELERFIEDNTGTVDTGEPEPEDTEPVKEDTKEKEPDIKENTPDKSDKKDLINQMSLEKGEKPEYISTKKASELIGKSVRTVQNYLNDDKLEGYKDGKSWKVKKSSINKLLEGEK